jgi:hypothetical protein
VLRIFDITTHVAATLVTVVVVLRCACVLFQSSLGAFLLCQRCVTVLDLVFDDSQYGSTFGFDQVAFCRQSVDNSAMRARAPSCTLNVWFCHFAGFYLCILSRLPLLQPRITLHLVSPRAGCIRVCFPCFIDFVPICASRSLPAQGNADFCTCRFHICRFILLQNCCHVAGFSLNV